MEKLDSRLQNEIQNAKYLVEHGPGMLWGWETPAGRVRVEARVQWLTRVCKLGTGVRVLECGCGTGIFTRRLAETGASITAVDVSSDLLNEARNMCTAPNVKFIEADLENPHELAPGAYDVLCGVSVLHHLDLPRALLALREKLRPGAIFAFSEPNLLNPINKYIVFTDDLEKRRARGVSPTEMAFYSKELRKLFEDAMYIVEELHHRDFMHPAVPKRLIPFVKVLQYIAERTPLVRSLSGSLWITGIRP